MRYTILLDKNEKVRNIEAQEQSRFVKLILETLEVPIEFDSEEQLSINDRIEIKRLLNSYSINIISDIDSGLKIYVKTDLIGEWKKPKYVLKEDRSQIDPNKRLYLEMNINFWTIFEEQEVETN